MQRTKKKLKPINVSVKLLENLDTSNTNTSPSKEKSTSKHAQRRKSYVPANDIIRQGLNLDLNQNQNNKYGSNLYPG